MAELKRTLGLFDAFAIGIGVGSGTMMILVLFSNLMQAFALANFGSLLYYLITNYAALKLEKRVYPRIIPVLGMITCLTLLRNRALFHDVSYR